MAAINGQELGSLALAPTVSRRTVEELEALGILADKKAPTLSDRIAQLLKNAGI